jgi:uncharacterized membrane protein
VAIRWLHTAPDGIVVEAVGGQYSDFAHISIYTGLPTVMGWPGHEDQWRGGGAVYISQIDNLHCGGGKSFGLRTREDDVRCLYETSEWDTAQIILQHYGIHYVYVGTLERTSYRVNEEKFQQFLKPVFQSGNVVIYEVP